MLHWSIEEKRLDLLYNWKISRNESVYKINFFIEINFQGIKGKGEVAPNIRYNETPALIVQQFEEFSKNFKEIPSGLDDFNEILKSYTLCNSLRFAIESAYVHYLCNKSNISIYELLNLPKPTGIYTSYTVPIIPAGEVKEFMEKYQLGRFKSIKVKINTDGFDLVNEIAKHYKGPIRIDANEAWKNVDDLLVFMQSLSKFNIDFIEQPLPYNLVDEYEFLKKKSPYLIIGDESITDNPDFDSLSKQFHGVNMKLMKAGGYLNGIRILQDTKKQKMKTMIGCMIETSLGISSGMHLCGLCDYVDLDGHFLISNEPFNLVDESDGMLLLKE